MNVGIIGYGSMGRMFYEKMSGCAIVGEAEFYISNRTQEKIEHLRNVCHVCDSNRQVAEQADILFLCVRPVDMKSILLEIKDSLKKDALLVSPNGSILLEHLSKICDVKIAKVIPCVTAEVNQAQTLVCYNEKVSETDKKVLKELFSCMGTVIELPEPEMGMGAELVSCMPGFLAAIFQEICASAKKHTSLSEDEIARMVLHTVVGTGTLMLEKEYSFHDVVERVATKGGITEEGTKVIEAQFPKIADDLFDKTLEKRRQTTEKAQKSFGEGEVR